MATITLGGNPVHSSGELPTIGARLPDFRLTRSDLSDVSLADFKGKVLVINIVPSLDTGVCAASARAFNMRIKESAGALVLTVSRDLPFAQRRFCEAEGIDAVITLSELRDRSFGKDYGVELIDGPMAGLLSRAVIVADTTGRVVYVEQVPEIKREPDYGKALDAVRAALAGY